MSRKLSGLYFPAFALNTGKYGPKNTPYLDTFNAVTKTLWCFNFLCFNITFVSELNGTANFIQKRKINERILLSIIDNSRYFTIYIYILMINTFRDVFPHMLRPVLFCWFELILQGRFSNIFWKTFLLLLKEKLSELYHSIL